MSSSAGAVVVREKTLLRVTYRVARRIVIAVVGGTLVLLGALMIVLPGPAMVVIPLGLAILSLEFAWARRWLKLVKKRAVYYSNQWQNKRNADPPGKGTSEEE